VIRRGSGAGPTAGSLGRAARTGGPSRSETPRPLRCLLWPAFLLAALGTPPARAQTPPETIVIRDMSGSMWGRIGDGTKLDIARGAVRGMFSRFPAGRRVGLMAYGHRRAGDCRDIEMLRPPGPWIGIAEPGSDAAARVGNAHAWVEGADSPLRVTAPGTPGTCEIRVIEGADGTILARRPLRVVAARATIEAPANSPPPARPAPTDCPTS
jgi:hypothetical protein